MNKLDDASNSTLVPTEKLKEMQERLTLLETKLGAAEEALKFYAKAKTLFASFNGDMPTGGQFGVRALPSFASETHVKDDGKKARAYFEKYGDNP